jgi:DNA-binding transcriptional LysR family regulator
MPASASARPCVGYRFDSGVDYRWEFERDGVEQEVAVRGPFTTNEQDLMVAAALDGLGIAFVFEALVEKELGARRLVRVLEDWCPSYPGLFLYYPPTAGCQEP